MARLVVARAGSVDQEPDSGTRQSLELGLIDATIASDVLIDDVAEGAGLQTDL